jgi:xanthine dehydrogenase accessory factor
VSKFYEELRKALERGATFAVATVVRTYASAPREPGAKMGLLSDGSIFGTIGGGKVEELVKKDALEVIRTNKPLLKRYSLVPSKNGGIGTECGGEVEIFIEPVCPSARLLIFGAGHIAEALFRMASMLGMEVEIIDERPEFARSDRFAGAIVRCMEISKLKVEDVMTPNTLVVIVTHDHGHDREALKLVLGRGAAYIGMIGSKRKVKAIFDSLTKDGKSKAELSRVHAPIGLDIGAEGPQEIALSILAEIIAVQRKGGSSVSMANTAGEK